MNQEKIGEFLKKLRSEKRLTQQELASKLGVSDKAISKWENGRCLMDIEFLKPLSEIFEVSIVEILSGERINDDDLSLKTNEVVKNTLNYSKDEIRKGKFKVISVMLISLIAIMFSLFFIKQSYYYFKYYVDDKYYVEFSNNFYFSEKYAVYKKTIPDEEYLILNEIKFRNVASLNNFIEDTEVNNNYSDNYNYIKFNNSAGQTRFIYSYTSSNLDMFKTLSFITENGDEYSANMQQFILDNDINNDIDLYKYINKHGYKFNSLFTTIDDMKFNNIYNKFITISNVSEVEYTYLIEGDYLGTIKKIKNQDVIYVNLIKNNKLYNFVFYAELADLKYVLDIISTVEIR